MQMEKIAVFGNSNQIHSIKSRMHNADNIVFTADCSTEGVADSSVLAHVMCIAADDLQETKLLSYGIDACQIINYSRFENSTLENPIEKFFDDCEYSGLILGMSHSQCAIETEKMTDQFYCKLSAPSLDMFCHFHFMKKLADDRADKLMNIKHIIIELPYYIFNYDLSKFGTFVNTKLNYFEIIGNYHNFGVNEEQQNCINEFRRFKKTFNKKAAESKSYKKRNIIIRIIKKFLKMHRIARNNDKVWSSLYNDTISENKKLWESLLSLLKEVCPKAQITVLVMPFNPVFRRSHRKIVKQMKTLFFDTLGGGDFKIIDHFYRMSKDSYFDDHCHLSASGSRKYMEILNETLANC